MGKCKHRNKTVRCWSNHTQTPQWYHSFKPLPNERYRRRYLDALVCDDCHVWLPLGPANDTPREVQQEIRAAEQALRHDAASIATRWSYIDETHCNCWFEGDGPCCRCGFDGDVETVCEVGYLARAIATHPEEQP